MVAYSWAALIGRRAFEALVVLIVLLWIPGLPPHVSFTSFDITPPRPLEGLLKPNERLNNAEHLFEGSLKGPESIATLNGEIYTGTHGGFVLKINKTGQLLPVVKFGEECDGLWEEQKCGRPLGLRFDSKGSLIVADAYYGLFKVNVKTGKYEQLVNVTVPIEGVLPMIPNDLDVDTDGTIYWSDSSTKFYLFDGVLSLLGDPSGRLLKYDPKTKNNTVLLDNIHFSNGVQLSPKKDFVLVSETGKGRVLRYYLKGAKAGTSDVFLDGLPGLPDNIRLNENGRFVVSLVMVRTSEMPSLLDSLAKFPLARRFLARVICLMQMPFSFINSVLPNQYTKRAEHWIGHFESIKALTPKGAIVLEAVLNGTIFSSYHNTDGTISAVSELERINGVYYLASPYNTFLGRVKPGVHVKVISSDNLVVG